MKIVYLVALVLAGCVSAEQEARDQAAREEAYRQQLVAQCRSYGFTMNTPDFQRCYMQVDLANRQASEAQRQLILNQYLQQEGIFRR